MLKRKLDRNAAAAVAAMDEKRTMSKTEKQFDENNQLVQSIPELSTHFAMPFWKRFYDLESLLNERLKNMQPPSDITHKYNPVEYAAQLHCAYLQRFLDGPKRVFFVGMNPGPNGMGQTGIPFGNIASVRDFMQLSGSVEQPACIHSKRPINGMECKIEEPSGVRIWTLLRRLANDSLDTFAKQCFVHNFCPLVFYDKNGKNITPSELKGKYKQFIRDVCLNTLDEQIKLVQPEIVVTVGDYVFTCMKKSSCASAVRVLKLPHPSPRAINNQNWPEKAENWLRENNLISYISNE